MSARPSREIVYQSERVLVSQLSEAEDDVVDKVVRAARADGQARRRLEHEFRLLSELVLDGVPRARSLKATDEGQVLRLDRAPGFSLDRVFGLEVASVREALTVGVSLARVLCNIHRAGLAHRHITPSNVVYERASGRVTVIDFALAARVRADAASQMRVGAPEGTPGFCAPEQTGRTATSIDHRVDQFGLGATLYWLLTGDAPASGRDLLEIVHRTVAVAPTPCAERRPEVPQALSAVIGRLLAKAPDDRYFRMEGVLSDLERCLHAEQAGEVLAGFEPGADEEPSRFRLPERLYGRDEALTVLGRALERVRSGSPTLVTLSGEAGSGKTALAEGLLPAVARVHGYMAAGKFEQLRQPRPYSALVDALRLLLRQLLARSVHKINLLRARVQAALGGQAAALAPILPELEVLLGEQPPARPLPPPEAKERFRGAMNGLFAALCAHEHPVVVLLDDVQWADRGSIELAQDVLAQPGLKVLVILAYRGAELPADHLARALPSALPDGAHYALDVEPLSVANVALLLSEVLRRPTEEVRGLARLIVTKTHGNAYFVREFLAALNAAGGIYWSVEERRWRWSDDQIAELPMADNVAALLTERLSALGEDTRLILSVAACVGQRIELRLLAEGLHRGVTQVAEGLLPAVDAGLLRPIGDALDTLHAIAQVQVPAGTSELVDCALHFSHDRVQHAACAHLSAQELPRVRLQLARRLYERAVATVEIVDQYNEALHLLSEPDERLRVAQLNLEAARAASESASFDTAHRYFRAGVHLLPATVEDAHRELAMALLLGAADAALMVPGQPDHAQLVARMLELSRTELERVAALDARLRWQLARYENAAALATVVEALRACGVALPRSANAFTSLVAIARTRLRMRNVTPAAFGQLRVAEDPLIASAMRLLVAAVTPAFYVNVQLVPILMLKLVNLSLKIGRAHV